MCADHEDLHFSALVPFILVTKIGSKDANYILLSQSLQKPV